MNRIFIVYGDEINISEWVNQDFFMKKLNNIDVYGYTAREFDDRLNGTVKRMLKRAQERESNQEMQAIFTAPRQNSRKFNRQSRTMEAK